eukprot:1672199-Rhodomonas_salina.1
MAKIFQEILGPDIVTCLDENTLPTPADLKRKFIIKVCLPCICMSFCIFCVSFYLFVSPCTCARLEAALWAGARRAHLLSSTQTLDPNPRPSTLDPRP